MKNIQPLKKFVEIADDFNQASVEAGDYLCRVLTARTGSGYSSNLMELQYVSADDEDHVVFYFEAGGGEEFNAKIERAVLLADDPLASAIDLRKQDEARLASEAGREWERIKYIQQAKERAAAEFDKLHPPK